MKCNIMLHFIWIFTVCKSTRLGFPENEGLKMVIVAEQAGFEGIRCECERTVRAQW